MASRSAKNLIYSGGRSLARSVVGGVKRVVKAYKTSHARKQAKLDAGYPRVDIEMGY